MGCTSSAPNMDGYPTAPDGSHKENDVNEDVVNNTESNKESGSTSGKSEINVVLPSCDNLEKNLELASQNSLRNESNLAESQTETVTSSLGIDNLDQAVSLDKELSKQVSNDAHATNNNEKQPEEHYSTLKEVVDRVISDNGLDIHIPTPDTDVASVVEENFDFEDEETIEPNTPSETLDVEEENVWSELKENKECPIEEITSPSQSECSRATRWEALADIAAELPPTLAVDPVTGQIYSLAK